MATLADSILNKKQAAAFLGISGQTLRNWVKREWLPNQRYYTSGTLLRHAEQIPSRGARSNSIPPGRKPNNSRRPKPRAGKTPPAAGLNLPAPLPDPKSSGKGATSDPSAETSSSADGEEPPESEGLLGLGFWGL